ncbi:MAG: hypothetical protein LBV17_05645 [Treponema sp.]|jgi:hypothetical protein|nr:hypothetical protein [Treponema sp.]
MLKKTKGLLFFLLLFSAPLFSHDANIKIEGENRYKSVRLTPPVYNAAHSGLSDLLIKNGGDNVPYFINSSEGKTNETRETYLMRLINSYKENDNFFFDYKLAFERNGDIIATSMEFFTRNTGFAKRADVFGSYDNIHWEFVQNDMLYVVDSKSKLNIDFKSPQKYTHYRLKFENNLEQISFFAVNLVYNLKISEETYFIESFTPEFTVETKDKKTEILIKGLKNLRLCDLQIETDSMFIRNVSASAGVGKELYNLSINGTTYKDTVLPLKRQVSENDIFIVIINDADDKPVNITGISVRYYADDLVFQGNPGSVYTLEFGLGLPREAPVYDIERYKNEILKGPIDRLVLGEIVYVPVEPPVEEIKSDLKYQKIIFNIIVSVTGILLAVMIIFKLRK